MPELSLPPLARFGPAAAAGLLAGATSAALPFYPAGWPLGLAAAAAGLALLRERAGLALALAVPLLPLGNISAGLAWAYAAVALAWLTLTWREPRSGLMFVAGPLLAPLSLLGLLPLAVYRVRSGVRRAAGTFVAVLVAAVVAGFREQPLPFTGEAAPALGLDRTASPFAAANALSQALSSQPTLLYEAVVLALAAVALPHVKRRAIGPFAALLLAALVLPDPSLPDTAIVATTLAICLGLAVKAES